MLTAAIASRFVKQDRSDEYDQMLAALRSIQADLAELEARVGDQLCRFRRVHVRTSLLRGLGPAPSALVGESPERHTLSSVPAGANRRDNP